MRKQAIIALAAALAVGAAWAGNGNNGGGNGGCGVGQTTNGCSGATDPSSPSNSANGIGVGVGIGTGVGIGRGGNATGGNASAQGGQGGVGIGGSVAGSGNSNVRNTNANSNANRNDNRLSNQQGQQQGQIATGGNARSGDVSSSNTSTQANAQSVVVQGDAYQAPRNPVSTAYAAPLAASNGTCLGSASGGAQTIGFGVSFGTTKLDEGCDARFDALALAAEGYRELAFARLCMKPEIRAASAASAVDQCAAVLKKSEAPARQPVATTASGSPYIN